VHPSAKDPIRNSPKSKRNRIKSFGNGSNLRARQKVFVYEPERLVDSAC
jgi:hypothetical protein